MKVTILGCGSAYGVPHVGNGWGNCDPNNPKNRRTTASILIEQHGTQLLVDMSPDYREQSSKHNVGKVDGVLFTHPHADHVAGIYNLPMMMTHFNDVNLPLIADEFTRENIERSYWFMFDDGVKIEYFGAGRPFWHEMKVCEPFQVGDMVVLAFPQIHGRMQSMGLRIGDFAYCTDVSAFPDKSFECLRGVKTWIVECNNEHDRGSKSHAYLQKVIGWANELNAERTILTHLEYTMDYDDITAKLPAGMELAYDGMVVEVGDNTLFQPKPMSKVHNPKFKP